MKLFKAALKVRYIVVVGLLIAAVSWGDLTIPHTFSNFTVASATEMNENFLEVELAVDGKIDEIIAGSGISATEVPTGTVTVSLATDPASLNLVTGGTMDISGANVGINTASPIANLDVNGNARFGNAAGLLSIGLGLGVGDSGIFIDYGGVAADTARIQAESQGVSFRDLVINPSGGNVGIGVANPAEALVVSSPGNTRVSIDGSTTANNGLEITSAGVKKWILYNLNLPIVFRSISYKRGSVNLTTVTVELGIGTVVLLISLSRTDPEAAGLGAVVITLPGG